MGSGLLYGGIGVLWLVFLGQRWLHRRTLVRAERSAPASSRQRIIEPRTDRRTRSTTVLAMTAVADRGSVRTAASGRAGSQPADTTGTVGVFEGIAVAARRSRAVRRRRRILVSLLVITAVMTVLGVLARVPVWAPVVAAAATLCWFVSGVSIARARRRARRGHRRRMRNRELARAVPEVSAAGPVRLMNPAAGDTDSSWDSVASVEVVARWGREHSDTDGFDREQLTAVVAPGPGSPLVPDLSTWQPVPVPLPSYLTAARVPRTVARIDFGIAGSWTSMIATTTGTADGVADGRGPVQLGRSAADPPRPEPRSSPAAAPRPRIEVEASAAAQQPHVRVVGVEDEPTAEVPYELPRAVGD